MICVACHRQIRKRIDGKCIVVMELEPGVLKRCGLERNAQVDPVWPHSWNGGFDHIRDERDIAICGCGHAKTEHVPSDEDGVNATICLPCNDAWMTWSNSGHAYSPGAIALDHEARE